MQTICISQHITFCARIVKTRDKIVNYLTLSYPRLPHMPISGRGSSNLAANKDMNHVKNIDKWGYSFLIE